MSRAVARLKLVWPAFAMLGGALLVLLVGSSSLEIECSRGGVGMCGWSQGSLTSRSSMVFRIADVREVRLVEGLGKGKTHSETALVFSNGHETHFGNATNDEAKELYYEAHAFFAPGSTIASYHYERHGSKLYYLASIALLAGAIAWGIHGFRKRILETVELPTAKLEPTIGDRARRRRLVMRIAGGGAAIIGIFVVFYVVATHGQGTLLLECQTRCRFQGGECLPGGEQRMSLDPGTYTIEIWTAAGSALWVPRQFDIAEGETTTYVCKP